MSSGQNQGWPGVADVSLSLQQQRADLSYTPDRQKPEVRHQTPSQGTNQAQGLGS